MKVTTGASHLDTYIWLSMSLKEAIELQKILSVSIYEVTRRGQEHKEKMNFNDGSGYPDYLNDFEVTVKP
jgi:hypothetical protein